jgi:hypothetical protein
MTFKVYKRGVLSRVAHDLQLSIALVTLEIDGDRVSGSIPMKSFTVDGFLAGGSVVAGSVSRKDAADILKKIRTIVLCSDDHPTAQIEGELDVESSSFHGTLTIMGRTAEIHTPVNGSAGSYAGTTEIIPTRWGIAPYKALLGAIQLQDRVEIGFQFGASGRNR